MGKLDDVWCEGQLDIDGRLGERPEITPGQARHAPSAEEMSDRPIFDGSQIADQPLWRDNDR